jgi:amino acid transporter
VIKEVVDILIGEPIENEKSHEEKFNIPSGLAVMSSDAISSVAYASEEILKVLLPVIGAASYIWLGYTSLMIIGLLVILTFSYLQTIKAYPHGGGSYTVSKENIGMKAGLFAGSALLIDYILTVSVSATAGIDAIISAFPNLKEHHVLLIIFTILVLTLLNLRGIGDSSKIFSIPTYIFIFSMLGMICYGLFKYFFILHGHAPAPVINVHLHNPAPGALTIFLILRAFAGGCSALTGLEAVSNGVPNFREPAQKRARKVLVYLSMIVFLIFGGTSLLANFYHAVFMGGNPTVVSQIAQGVFGKNFMYYIIQFSTAVILMMACNTAFADFPMLMYIIGRDGYAPRQFTVRGQRLSFSTGIVVLSVIASILVIIFGGSTTRLIPLYSVGVFLSFTLSQSGMVIHWIKSKESGWRWRAVINGFGAIVTLVTIIVIGYEKFRDGAWVVVILIPSLVILMSMVKKHYNSVATGLRANEEDLCTLQEYRQFTHHIIVPISSLSKPTIYALEYARSLTSNVIAIHVGTDNKSIDKLKKQWKDMDIDVLLITKYSRYRTIVGPLIKYISDISKSAGPNEKVTVIMPEFVTHKWWGKLLHNHTSFFLREAMLNFSNKNIAITTFPYHL